MTETTKIRSEKVAMPAVMFRDPKPGEVALIVSRQAALYAAEYGWNTGYEALAMEIASAFLRDFKPERERCWVADLDGQLAGAVFMVEKNADTAQLRLLHVEASARGNGIGGRLVDECIAFARSCGYRELVLWTNDILVSARKIYQAAGFELVGEDSHFSFGHNLVGQNWRLKL